MGFTYETNQIPITPGEKRVMFTLVSCCKCPFPLPSMYGKCINIPDMDAMGLVSQNHLLKPFIRGGRAGEVGD